MAVNLDKLNKVNEARQILEIVAAAPSTSWERIGEAVELLREVEAKDKSEFMIQKWNDIYLADDEVNSRSNT